MSSRVSVHIDLLDFLRTGEFGPLKLGQTKEWIGKNFAKPDMVYRNNDESPIWHYGNIELHFHDDNHLFLVHADHIDSLTGGEVIDLNKWIFDRPQMLTLEYVICHLNKERISFKLQHKLLPQGFVCVNIELLDSKVLLGFRPDESEYDLKKLLDYFKIADSNEFKLESFSLSSIM